MIGQSTKDIYINWRDLWATLRRTLALDLTQGDMARLLAVVDADTEGMGRVSMTRFQAFALDLGTVVSSLRANFQQVYQEPGRRGDPVPLLLEACWGADELGNAPPDDLVTALDEAYGITITLSEARRLLFLTDSRACGKIDLRGIVTF